jgi:hypothetical protein
MNGTVDHRPQTLSSCIVNGKLDIRRVREFQKRSYEEVEGVVTELLFAKSQFQQEGGAADEQEEHDETTNGGVRAPQTKKRRKEKHVIMFTNPITGERLRLLPRVSLW